MPTATVQNPVLRGMNPDPSICRVGEDYYLATSTFQWFPGVDLYHSRDLIHWEALPSPLRRVSQLDLLGIPNSGGVWAPCLSYSDGVFYLIYTVVTSQHGIYKDTHNYLVTATDPRGEWSEPVYLNSSGFDPSLFHGEDGRKWLLNMRWDPRMDKHPFAGILLQEYDPTAKRLIGTPKLIYDATEIGLTEAPHLYKIGEYYYLMVAEGGTSYRHGIRMARSHALLGPYETDPKPLLTTRDHPDYPLQRAGHGCLFDTPDGRWHTVFLCGRPITDKQRCILGRETGIAPLSLNDNGWFRLADGGVLPPLQFESHLPEVTYPDEEAEGCDFFSFDELPPRYKTLRIPFSDEMGSLTARKGWLRLYGRESMQSHHRQSLVVRRLCHHVAGITVKMEFSPRDFQQEAGLTVFYDTCNFFYLFVTGDGEGGRELRLLERRNLVFADPLGGAIPINRDGAVWLRARMDYGRLTFFYSTDGRDFHAVCGVLDATNLSDEAYKEMGDHGFTGTFVGMACQDLSGGADGETAYADFAYLDYSTMQ